MGFDVHVCSVAVRVLCACARVCVSPPWPVRLLACNTARLPAAHVLYGLTSTKCRRHAVPRPAPRVSDLVPGLFVVVCW